LLLLRRLTFLRFFDLFLLSASCLGFGLLLPVFTVLIRVDDPEIPFLAHSGHAFSDLLRFESPQRL